MTLTIRPAEPRDAKSLSAIVRAAYETLMRGAYDARQLAAAVEKMGRANPALLASGTYYLVETDAGARVGCGGWTRRRPGGGEVTPGLAHLRHFATHPDWAGRGVGGLIYVRCEEEALQAGVEMFECYSSRNAERFYQSLGFATLGAINIKLGPDIAFPCLRMTRRIK